eukprot:SAG31_NODE_30_length_32545_cov_9.378999_4_plen_114_part_00
MCRVTVTDIRAAAEGPGRRAQIGRTATALAPLGRARCMAGAVCPPELVDLFIPAAASAANELSELRLNLDGAVVRRQALAEAVLQRPVRISRTPRIRDTDSPVISDVVLLSRF